MQILRPIWALKPETAGRLRGRIERILAVKVHSPELITGSNALKITELTKNLTPELNEHLGTPAIEVCFAIPGGQHPARWRYVCCSLGLT